MKPKAGSARLTEGPEGKSILSLMIPMMLGMVALISYTVVDAYFISRLGTMELAAVSFTFPVAFIVTAVSMSFSVGTSSVVARLMGSGDREKVQRMTTHAMLLGVFAGMLVLILGVLTIDPVFTALGADEVTLPIIHDYMQIYFFGGIFLVVPTIGNSVLRATGDAKTPAAIMTIAALFNVILDPILIFGLFGVPRLEVQGAALASVIANMGTLVVSFSVLYFREHLIKLRTLFSLSLILDSWKRILHVALPTMVSSLIAPATTTFITYQVARFGQEAVAGFGLAARVESLSLLVLMSLGGAITPFVGQNFGARKYDRVQTGMNFCFRFSLIYGLVVAAIVAISAKFIAGLFTDDPLASHAANLQMWIVPISYTLLGFSMASNGAFNAMGKPRQAMFISLSRTLVVYVPLAWLLSRLFGLAGIFVAASCANFASGVIGYLWFRASFSKKFLDRQHA